MARRKSLLGGLLGKPKRRKKYKGFFGTLLEEQKRSKKSNWSNKRKRK